MFKMILFDLHPECVRGIRKQKLLYFAKRSFTAFSLIFVLLVNIQFFIYAIVNSDNFAIMAEAIANSFSGLLIGAKAAITFLRKDEIWEISEGLKAVFISRDDDKATYDVKKYLLAYLRIAKTFSCISFFLVLTTFVPPLLLFILFGVMNPATHFWFPFDVFQPKTFPIALFWTDFSTYTCCFLLMGSDLLLYALISVITMEYDFLKMDFMNLGLEPEGERRKRFKRLIDRHNTILQLTDKLESVYEPIFLLDFVISSVIMCLILFQLSSALSDIPSNAFLVPLLVIMGGQILLLCVLGQNLTNASVGVADGIYDCDWMSFNDHEFTKQISFIIMQAQRPKKLTAMKFADVSVETFTNVRNI